MVLVPVKETGRAGSLGPCLPATPVQPAFQPHVILLMAPSLLEGELKVTCIQTKDNAADIFMKALNRNDFEQLRLQIGLQHCD